MTVEYFIQTPPPYPHEADALRRLAQQMHRAFAAVESFYLLAANIRFWEAQADALIFTPHALTVIELKACDAPVSGRVHGPWRVGDNLLRGGSAENPYQQIVTLRQTFIKYLDRNRRRFLPGERATALKGRWGHVSAALVFAPYLHPASHIITPSEAAPWLGLIGLNEVAEFIFSRISPNFDLRPQELRDLAQGTLGCRPWTEIAPLLPTDGSGAGRLWLLDADGRRTYAFPVRDGLTLGRSQENNVVIPRRYNRTSRLHAMLRVHGGEVWLYDRQSTHGIYVNGARVAAPQGIMLHAGDAIALGTGDHPATCHLLFESHTAAVPRTEITAETQR
ncbi:MAG TPA: FHA domain-containing protein [Anaerolineae bacterium]|nr:FHA domain-containing protein [Anaerolineae bacterium]